jgi:hypothetical protein
MAGAAGIDEIDRRPELRNGERALDLRGLGSIHCTTT